MVRRLWGDTKAYEGKGKSKNQYLQWPTPVEPRRVSRSLPTAVVSQGNIWTSSVTNDVGGAVTDQWAGLPLALLAVKMKRKITKNECPSETFLRDVVAPQVPKIA